MGSAQALFNQRIVQEACKGVPDSIPSDHQEIIRDWTLTIESGDIYEFQETEFKPRFINQIIVKLLGYQEYEFAKTYTLRHEKQLKRGPVDLAIGNFKGKTKGQILAPFELKGAKVKDLDAIVPGRQESPVKQAWDYALNNKGTQWVLVSNFIEIRLYAYSHGQNYYETFDLSKLEDPIEYKRLMLLLSAQNLISGNTKNLLETSDKADDEITDKLYQDYKSLRYEIVKSIVDHNSDANYVEAIGHAQTLLDRVLFIAFAEDTQLLPSKTLAQLVEEAEQSFISTSLWDHLKALFDAIDKGKPPRDIPAYNGGLFKESERLNGLTLPDEICKRLLSLGNYNFQSEVSVEILGHIFEQSISDIEEIKAQAQEEDSIEIPEKRKSDGVYYTPAYITRYLVERTIGAWLHQKKKDLGFEKLPNLTEKDYGSIRQLKTRDGIKGNANIEKHYSAWINYKNVLSEVKILDPACGSGAFLIEVFNLLVREGHEVNSALSELRLGQADIFRWDKHILQNNLFGVDLNGESVEITKLSLWLKTANPREPLTYLDNNIKCGNSVLDSNTLAKRSAFHWEKEFSSIIESGGFDIVIGNPPYINANRLSKIYGKKVKDYWKKRFASASGAYDIYILFFELGLTLLSKNGLLGFITPNKYLSAPYSEELRKLILDKYTMQECVDLSNVRVFEDPSVYPIITIFQNSIAKKSHTISLPLFEDGTFVADSSSLDLNYLHVLPAKMFSLLLAQNRDLTIKILKNGKPLSEIAEVNATSTASEADYISQYIKEDDGVSHKLINTGTIDRYCSLWGIKELTDSGKKFKNPVVDLDEIELSDHRLHIYNSAKIIFAKLANFPEAFLDSKGEFLSINTNCVFDPQQEINLEFLLALLNSKVMRFTYEEFFGALRMSGGYLQFQAPQLRCLPIATGTKPQRKAISTRSIEIIDLIETDRTIKDQFLNYLADDFEITSIPNKLQSWHELSWKELRKEIEKLDIQLDGQLKDEWYKRFKDTAKELAKIQQKISKLESEIDSQVFKLYKLNDSEIGWIDSKFA